MSVFGEPSVIIALLGSLGVGAILLEVARSVLGRKRTTVDINASSIESADKVIQLHAAATAKMADDMTALESKFDKVSDKLDAVLDLVAKEKRWARVNGHGDAPVLQAQKGA